MAKALGGSDPILGKLVDFAHVRLPRSEKQPQRRLLKALASGAKTKAELVEKVGGNEQYVATNLTRLREHLDKIFDEELDGTRSFRRLQMPEPDDDAKHRRHELFVTRNPHPVAQFWSGHGTLSDPTHLVWAEPLVFYENTKGNRSYVRYLDLNDPGNVPKTHPAKKLRLCYGYQSSGDIESVHLLEQEFAKQKIGTHRRLIRGLAQDGVRACHAVIIGNGRMNPHVGLFQQGLDFTVESDHARLKKKSGEKQLFDYSPTPELEKYPAYVILTRAPHHHKTLTMISGNQGRAVQRVVETLVSDDLLEYVWSHIGGAALDAWPSKFQLLFEVQVQRSEFVDDYRGAEPRDLKIYSMDVNEPRNRLDRTV